MALFACGDKCAPPTWDVASLHLGVGFGLWLILLLSSYALSIWSISSNPESLHATAHRWRRTLHSNTGYVTLHAAFSGAQYIQFCMRTLSGSVSDVGLAIDLVACALFGIELLLGWLDAWLSGLVRGHLYVFSWGVLDCLLLPSVFLMLVPIDGQLSWGSFSFLSALHLMQSWQWFLSCLHLKTQKIEWQAISLTGEGLMWVGFFAMLMLEAELLGDPATFAAMQEDEWNTSSALYAVFMSVATVGSADVMPATFVGKGVVLLAMIVGVCLLAGAARKVATVATEEGAGCGSFVPGIRSRPIVVSGNPTAAMLKDFISEMLHPDHADDAEDIHLVFLYPRGGPEMDEAIRYLRRKDKADIAARTSVFQGSVLDANDLQRVGAERAVALYVLPNVRCENPFQEDAENIIRMIALRRYLPSARLILLLLKADSRHILEDAGINASSADAELTIIAVDQFKLELIGKSCEVLGFAPFICNLCKSVGEEDDDVAAQQASWVKDYMQGVGNELYEIELSPVYGDSRQAIFAEVAIDVLEQTGGYVYLIGLVEQSSRGEGKRTILVNPGVQYQIKATTSGVRTFGIFIAADRDSIVQCEVGMVFLGRRERPSAELGPRAAGRYQISPKPPLPGGQGLLKLAGPVLAARAQHLTLLSTRHQRGRQPERPPLKTLAAGGHILVLCVGTKGEKDFRLSAHHFVSPLRRGSDIASMTPIVIMAAAPPRDWETVCDQPKVYFLTGSPLSQLDLERANFRAASTIFICNVASSPSQDALAESWIVDSEMICCSRLVESQLPAGARTLVVADLKDDQNHWFLPVPATSNIGGTVAQPRSKSMSASRMMYESDGSEAPRKSGRISAFLSEASSLAYASEREETQDNARKYEYFRQPRFASGQLYASTIITSLVANTFYSPSLSELLRSMVAADVHTVPVPPAWAGKSYFEYFDHLLWTEERLAVCILRRADPARLGAGGAVGRSKGRAGKRRFAFVYTAPPAKETTMLETDVVICFGRSAATKPSEGAARRAPAPSAR